MPPNNLAEIFLSSVNEVLEVMFFTGVEEDCCKPSSHDISAELQFEGKCDGKFGIQVSRATGSAMAGNFLGVDAPDLQQVEEVVCELCNMLCGSVLSRLDPHARFVLVTPVVDTQNTDFTERQDAVGCTVGIAEGPITVWMQFAGSPAIQSAA